MLHSRIVEGRNELGSSSFFFQEHFDTLHTQCRNIEHLHEDIQYRFFFHKMPAFLTFTFLIYNDFVVDNAYMVNSTGSSAFAFDF